MGDTITLHGNMQGFLWRDEKSGASRLLLETDFPMYVESQYKRMRIDRGFEGDVAWYDVSVNAYETPCPAYDDMAPICVRGRFQPAKDARFQWDFVAESIEPDADRETAMRFLAKMIGYAAARSVIAHVGHDIYGYGSNQEAANALVAAAGVEKARRTIAVIKRLKVTCDTFRLLSGAGVPYPYVLKAVKKYGVVAAERIAESPYAVCQALGIGFREADAIAKGRDVERLSVERMAFAGRAAVREATGSGHTRIPVALVQRAYAKLVGGNADVTVPFTEHPQMGVRVVGGENAYVIVDELDQAEKRICQNIFRLIQLNKKRDFRVGVIEEIEAQNGICLGNQQRKTVERILGTPGISIMTGGPGTGKTTTLRTMLEAYRTSYPNRTIRCCAPTGRAAQKMSESTGFPATTMHRTLEVRPMGDDFVCRNRENPIEADLVVIDEMSMADVQIFDKFVEALRTGTDLWLVGDPDQLEAVGPGAVLYDIISASKGLIDVCQLTEVFRQKAGSPIIKNAKAILNGSAQLTTCDSFTITKTTGQETLAATVRMAVDAYDAADPFRTQVLTPANTGTAGVNALNKAIQAAVNPLRQGERQMVYGSLTFRPRDKVIMVHNNYDTEYGYCNGDVGVIKSCDGASITINSRGRDIVIPRSMFNEVRLAYAMTIHKSQGSDFENVIIALPGDMAHMMTQNLLYTAVTRARSGVAIVDDRGSLAKAVWESRKGTRQTYLQTYIAEEKARRGMKTSVAA